jgi:hypothetical protein
MGPVRYDNYFSPLLTLLLLITYNKFICRSLGVDITNISINDVRPINAADLRDAMRVIRSSVSNDSLKYYNDWNAEYGSSSCPISFE